jgi:hypothetical protein
LDQSSVYVLTIFTSRIGFENKSNADFLELFAKEGLLKFRKDKPRYMSAAPFQDSGGYEMWPVNVVIYDESDGFIQGGVSLQEYKRLQPSGAPITWWIKGTKQDPLFSQLWEIGFFRVDVSM